MVKEWCWHNLISSQQCSECQSEEVCPSAGKQQCLCILAKSDHPLSLGWTSGWSFLGMLRLLLPFSTFYFPQSPDIPFPSSQIDILPQQTWSGFFYTSIKKMLSCNDWGENMLMFSKEKQKNNFFKLTFLGLLWLLGWFWSGGWRQWSW